MCITGHEITLSLFQLLNSLSNIVQARVQKFLPLLYPSFPEHTTYGTRQNTQEKYMFL